MKQAIKVYTVEGDEEIKGTIKRCWDDNQYTICPHTAVGVAYYYRHSKAIQGLVVKFLTQLFEWLTITATVKLFRGKGSNSSYSYWSGLLLPPR